ncbi:uncharacterized protein LOC118195713 [Stegodyphus dumicola]|uniref:uncharacterized protein LOC118195713 n=1 Tax=Stegodyphus dumicola TaxID=202533 RepID=UPI0015AC3C0A|nr:uncharacterized protein LOC118195713 [Stegodyphus dumicola]
MQQSQNVIDEVQESARKLRDLVLRIRTKQASHADVNKFESDVQKLVARWDNARSQIVERLRSCGASSELLRAYKTKMEKDSVWISETTVKMNSMKTVKKMTTKEIEMTVEPAMDLYSSVAERCSSIEQTNILGARYIREAKIYDLRLKHYKENLEEEHPSLDASLQKKAAVFSGADTVATELERINQEYSSLLQQILNYLDELKNAFSKHQKLKWLTVISQASPVTLKTYSSLIDQVSSVEPITTSENDTSACILTSHLQENVLTSNAKISAKGNSKLHQSILYSEETKFSPVTQSKLVLSKTSDMKNSRTNVQNEELMSQNICSVKGIFNPKTGKMATLYEAVEQNILNFTNAEFSDLRTGRRMSLQEAVVKGFIDQAFYDKVSTKCGIYFPGTKEELSLVEAVQKGLYDIQKGTLLNPQDGKPLTLNEAFHNGIIKKSGIKTLINMKLIKTTNLTLSEAIEQEFLNPKTGIFREPLTGHTMPFKMAVDQGFINISAFSEPECGISLSEAVDRNIIHDHSGQILDQDSGEKYTLDEAITKGILRSDICEIVDVKNKIAVPLSSALNQGIIHAQSGKFINTETSEHYTIKTARERNLILKPFTLKEALEKGFADDNSIIDPIIGQKLSILEALSRGILDAESKCVVDSLSSELLSLPEALHRGTILPSAKYFDSESGRELPLSSALDEGFITSVSCKMIFDIEGIKDTKVNELISFSTSLERNIIDLKKELFLDTSSEQKISLEEAVSRGFIQHQIYDMLCKPIGIKDCGKELNLIECCKKDYIDHKTGQLKDPKTKKALYVKEAIQKGVITPEGAALLKGLLNITVTMATVTRTITKFVSVPSDSELVSGDVVAQNIMNEVSNVLEKHTEVRSTSKSDKIDHKILPQIQKNLEPVSNSKAVLNSSQTSEKQSFLPIRKKTKVEGVVSSVKNSFYAKSLPQKSSAPGNEVLDPQRQYFSTLKDTKASQGIPEKIPVMSKSSLKSKFTKDALTEEYSKGGVFDDQKEVFERQSSQSMQVLELPPDGWYLKDAISQKLFDPHTGLFTVPGTDRLVSFEETVKLNIINPKSALVVVPNSKQTVPLDSALEMKILDSTGHYNAKMGSNFSMQKAIEEDVIIMSDSAGQDKSKSASSCFTATQFPVSQICPENLDTVIQEHMELPSIKTSYETIKSYNISEDHSVQNVHGLAKTLHSPEREAIILHKIPKKLLSPKDAALEGFIDQETANILLEAIAKKGNKAGLMEIKGFEDKLNHGHVTDYQKGELISVTKALQVGLIDNRTGKLLIPVGCSVSLSEALDNGLIHKVSQKIIHPESGQQLSIEEAIMCDILNPYSFYADPVGKVRVTIADAITKGQINSRTGEILTVSGNISILEAVHRKLFHSVKCAFKSPPLVALTFPTALQYGYIDIDSKEYILPSNQERISLQKAFDTGKLMVIPVQPQREYFLLDDALNKKLIDSKKFTFKHPVTGEITDLREAMSSGLLVAKSVRLTLTPFTSYQTESTVQTTNKYSNDINVSEEFSEAERTDYSAMPFSTAVMENALDLDSGTFYDKFSKRTYPIPEAIKLQILVPLEQVQENTLEEKYSLCQALYSLYDEKSKKFLEPNTKKLVSFEYLVKNNYIDLESLIYDANKKCILTLNDAIKLNIIDIHSGHYVQKDGKKLNAIEATKLGLLAFISVPNPDIKSVIMDVAYGRSQISHPRPSSLPLEKNALEVKSLLSSTKISSASKQVNGNYQSENFKAPSTKKYKVDRKSSPRSGTCYDSDEYYVENVCESVVIPSGQKVKPVDQTDNLYSKKQTSTLDKFSGENSQPICVSTSESHSETRSVKSEKRLGSPTKSEFLQTPYLKHGESSKPVDEGEDSFIMIGSDFETEPIKNTDYLSKIHSPSKTEKFQAKSLSEKTNYLSVTSEISEKAEPYYSETYKTDVMNQKSYVSESASYSSIDLVPSQKYSLPLETKNDSPVKTSDSVTEIFEPEGKELASACRPESPSKQYKIPVKKILSPTSHTVSPVREPESPTKQHKSEVKQFVSSTERSESYTRGQESPVKYPKSPTKQTESSIKQPKSPTKQLKSPKKIESSVKEPDTPTIQSESIILQSEVSPKQCKSLTKQPEHSAKLSESFTKQSEPQTSLTKQLKDAVLQKELSSKESDSVIKWLESSSKQSDFQTQQSESLSRESHSPSKRPESPVKGADSPVKHAESPFKQPKSPVKQLELPAKQSESPTKQPEFLAKQAESASKTPESASKQGESLTKLPEFSTRQAESPAKQPESLSKQSESPTKKPEYPAKQPESVTKPPEPQTKRPESPAKQAQFPTRRSVSPNKQPESPSRKSVPPTKQPESPSRRSVSPTKQPESPTRRSVSPTKQPESQPRRSVSPTKQPESPTRRSVSPTKQPESPSRQPESPTKQAESPTRWSESPAKHLGSTTKHPESSIKLPESPVKQQEFPTRRAGSPTKRAESPIRMPDSPTKIPESPPKRPESLIKKPESPPKRPESLMKRPESPTKRPELPIRKAESSAKQPESPVKRPEPSSKWEEPLIKPFEICNKQSDSFNQKSEFSMKLSQSFIRKSEISDKKPEISNKEAEQNALLSHLKSGGFVSNKDFISENSDVASTETFTYTIKSMKMDEKSTNEDEIFGSKLVAETVPSESFLRESLADESKGSSLFKELLSPSEIHRSEREVLLTSEIKMPEDQLFAQKLTKIDRKTFPCNTSKISTKFVTENTDTCIQETLPLVEDKAVITTSLSEPKISSLILTESCVKETKSESKEAKTSDGETKASILAPKSPVKSTKSTKSLMNDVKSPVQECELVDKENKSSEWKAESPVRDSKLPIEEGKSPLKDGKLPIQEHASSVTDIKLSLKECKSIWKETSPERAVKSAVREIESSVSNNKSPISEAKYPGRESKSPLKEDKPLVREFKSPIRQDKQPVREEKSPIREANSSVSEDKSSVKESKSFVKETKSPVRESKSTVRESKSPVKETKSPVRENKSPAREPKSPVKETKSPVKETKSPVREDKSPAREPKSPVKETKSPVREDKSPIRETKSPVREDESLVRESKSPVREGKSPVKETKSPKREDKSPVKECKSPMRESKSAVREPNLPVKECKSPVKETKFPVKESKSPVSEVSYPGEEIKFSTREAKSPVRELKSVKEAESEPHGREMKSAVEEASPVTKSKSPVREARSPVRESKSPVREVKSPAKELRSPVKKHKSPVRKAESPIRESKSPQRDSATETKSSGTEPKSSIRESKSPVREPKSPIRENKSFVRDSKFPVREPKSPVKQSRSPTREQKSPLRDSKTSIQEAKSDIEPISPMQDAKSPLEMSTRSPEREVKSPNKEIKNQLVGEGSFYDTDTKSLMKETELSTAFSPNEMKGLDWKSSEGTEMEVCVSETKSSVRKTLSLSSEMKSNDTETGLNSERISPVTEEKSRSLSVDEMLMFQENESSSVDIKKPDKEIRTAFQRKTVVKETELPRRENKSPVKEYKSRVRDTKSPVKEPKSSIRDTKSPMKEPKSPIRDTKAPVKESTSPVKESKSPVKDSKLPVKETISSVKSISPTRETKIVKSEMKANVIDNSTQNNIEDLNKGKEGDLSSTVSQLLLSPTLREPSETQENYSISRTAVTVKESYTEVTKQFQISSIPPQICVADAVASGIIQPNSCHILTERGKVLLQKALDENFILSDTKVEILNSNEVVLPDEKSPKLPLEMSAAIIEENHKVCKENAAKLTSWMKDIEFKLADLGVVREQLPGLQHQITVVKILKEELENQQHLVTGCLDEMRQLAQRGIEVLNKEEITLLQGNLISLKKRYDSILNECDRLLRRLTSAFEELQKYKSELDALKEWLNNAQLESKRKEEALSSLTELEKNSEAFRLFSSDVIAHQADLRFITMAAQKFIDESQDYLKALNAFRKNLPQSMPTIKTTESEVKSEVQEVTAVYHNLLNHVTRLTDNYSIICNKYRTYIEAVQKTVNWLNEVRKSSKKALEEPVADEPSLVQEQMDKIKLINMEVVGQGRLVENICQAFKILIDTLETCHVIPNEAKSIEQTVSSIQEDYIQLVNCIAERIKELQAALIHSQDIQGALDRILKWLEETETTMKMHNKPISLTIEKLDEQVQEFKILKSDIDNQKQSLDMLLSTASELTNNANPKLVRKVDSKVKEISKRFDKLCEKITKRGNLLEEISDSVRIFQAMVVQFEEWNSATLDRIESTDSVHLVDVDGFSSIIEYTLNQRNSKKDDFEQMIKIGKNLISKKDVSDVTLLKDKIQTLEQQWKNLGEILNEKKQMGKNRAEQLAAYEALRVKVLDWLLKIERDFETTEPIALDQSTLKKQSSEILGLLKEHSDYSSTVEKLNSLGTSCDTVVKGDTSPKRKATSPIKKPSSPTRKSPPSMYLCASLTLTYFYMIALKYFLV